MKSPLDDILSRLPHGEPFRFVTRVVALEPGASGRGSWDVRGHEDFLRGHFPQRPLVPGVLIGEALAQLSGLVILSDSANESAVLAHVDLRLKSLVAPPATIDLHSRVERSLGRLHQFEVEATVDGVRVAQGKLTLASADQAHADKAV